jgi:hypothetical protein
MTTPTIDAEKLTGITLKKGGHASPEAGMCLMEAVAYVRGIGHTDHPACVAPLLGEMGRTLNDILPDALRQQLVPLIPDLPGTADDGHDEERSYMALDWLIRVYLPTWLELSPACREDAAKVRELGRIIDMASAERAGPVVEQARKTAHARAARAAWDAAWDAAGDVARVAAWDAGDVARAAARAAWVAAWAAGDVAWDAADAARDVAGDVAWDVARAAARDVAGDVAWDVARAAARAALRPTVEALQLSAIELYGRMTRVGHEVSA